MPRILGLDLGSNSIGWSLVETSTNGKSGKLLATGVRVFPEGVDRDQTGSEKPKNEKRRIARGMRRQIARRARRKATLRRHLQQLGWIPVLEADRLAWDRLDPYELRDKALREALTLPELARVLVHLNQRRGFLSNRKADAAQRKENSATLQEISQLASELQGSTLGQHLAEKRKDPYRRVRGIHTHRQMFLDEFDRIWCAQQKYHPKVLTEQLRNGQTIPDERRYPREPLPRRDHKRVSLLDRFGLFGLIFFQRDLYWPRSVVGNCELEPKQKRCERADRLAQRFRLLQEVNNLRIIPGYQKDRELTPDERSELLKYLSGRKEATFDEIRKKLKLLEGTGFNLEVGDRRKLQGMPIDALLGNKNYFGKAWEKFSDEWKNQIVRDLLDNDEPTLRDKAARDWQLPPETIERLLETDLGQGYMSYSRMAIQKLLPYLEEELPLMSKDGSPSALQRAGYLRPDQRVVNQKESLPAVPDDILNPLVKQALFEVRKVVNGLLREYGKPDAIHIEMAREVKGNSIVRAKQAADMRSRERLREQAADAIRELGDKATHNKIDRWLLWREQGEICLYSGKNISPRKLLSGEVDVDHILPYSKSLDNSLMNKVICFRSENALKGQNTIHQWLAASNPQKLEQILQRAMKLPLDIRNRKLTKLKQETVVLDEFLQRQLSDTAYITSKVREYVQCLGCDVVCSKGQLTKELRHFWGLDTVLRDDGLDLKNREDHRHHAVDAIVIALTDRKRLQALARVRSTDQVLPEPWPNFRAEVQDTIDGLFVSRRAERGISGALHEETLYGPTQKREQPVAQADRPNSQGWTEKSGVFVCRKPLESLTAAMIEDIRDAQVRELVIQRLQQHNIDHTAKDVKIPKEVWNEPLLMIRKGHRQSSNPTQIKKVRLLRRDLTIQPIRQGAAFVKPGNTHHIAIFEYQERGKTKRDMIAVTMLEAIQRVKRREPIVSRIHPERPDAKFVMSLSRGETVWATIKGQEDLYVYRTAASTQGQIYFVKHIDARKSSETQTFSVKANTLSGQKVVVDPLGRLRNAND